MSDKGRALPLGALRWSVTALAGIAIVAVVVVALAGELAIPIAIGSGVTLLVMAAVIFGQLKASPSHTPSPVVAAHSSMAREALDHLGDPLIILDASGRIVLANTSSQSLIGAASERKHISAVLRIPDILEAVNRVLQSGIAENVPFTFLVPVERHYEAYIAATAGKGVGYVLIQFHDLTAVRRSEQMRADFVANASHELRTPLAAVSGFIQTLRGHARDDSKARERFLDIMLVETSRMQRLIDDLMSLTRIELNEHNPPSSIVDVVATARDAAAALAPLAEADGTTITVEQHEPLFVVGDRDELIQVFQNLIHNAIKYGRDNGQVKVGFARVPGQARREAAGLISVSVADDGEGIAREAIPRLTERFYRVDVKRSRERGGTGLGLAIVKHILNRHHARLAIESILGEGSTFTVILPAASV